MSGRNVYLVGFMGSGKTEVGRRLAQALGWAFADTDEMVARAAGTGIPDIFAREGEAGFRQREEAAVAEAASGTALVVATGGGAFMRWRNADVMERTGVTVYLMVDVDTALSRLGDCNGRPLLASPDTAERRRRALDLLADREPLYRRAAVTVDATRPADQVVAAILERLRSMGFA